MGSINTVSSGMTAQRATPPAYGCHGGCREEGSGRRGGGAGVADRSGLRRHTMRDDRVSAGTLAWRVPAPGPGPGDLGRRGL
jgi:hypothetical protein